MAPFKPTPPADLGRPDERSLRYAALERVRSTLDREHPLRLAGRDAARARYLESRNPARPEERIGRVAVASGADVHEAVSTAEQAAREWSRLAAEKRIGALRRTAELMRARRAELGALVLLETGKTWAEADGEIAESIDFLEYHASVYAQMLERAAVAVRSHPGERNTYRYLPLGVTVAIPPWPFPIAQLVAMVSAMIVGGNAVVVKPASGAPVTSRTVVDLFLDGGVPREVVSVLFGPGAEVGRALVRHPATRAVAATGSTATGRAIARAAADPDGEPHGFTKVVLELAGRNAVVVDETADLDAAAAGIVASAFGFSGQKCSAASRAIVVREVHDALVERVVAAAEALTVGDPAAFESDLGPVFNEAAAARVRRYLELGRREAKLIAGGDAAEAGATYLQPSVFMEVAADARLVRDEIFGPVLAIVEARDADHALAIANAGEYGLTGAYYSSDEARITRAREAFHVGSLYLNRKTTGSQVGFHPFGGFGLSGTDAKAGGPDYPMNYVQAQVISEQRR